MKTSILTFASLAVLVMRSAPASADAFDAALTRAVAAKELAMDHPEPTQWQAAFERFLEADGIGPSAETKYELGFIAVQLRQEDLAVEYYEASLDLGLTGPAREKAQRYVEEHGASMARLLVRGPGGGRVRIRGIERGRLPLLRPLVVFAGNAQVEVKTPSRTATASRTISLLAGRITEVDWDADDLARVVPTPSESPAPLQSVPPPRRVVPGAAVAPLALESPAAETTADKGSGGRTAGRWLLGSGIGVLLSSGMMVAVSMTKLSQRRRQLHEACEQPLPGSVDGCQNAQPGRYYEALGLADDIARWRTVQSFAWIGVGVGALGSAVGWAMLSRKSTAAQTVARFVPTPAIGQRSVFLTCRITF